MERGSSNHRHHHMAWATCLHGGSLASDLATAGIVALLVTASVLPLAGCSTTSEVAPSEGQVPEATADKATDGTDGKNEAKDAETDEGDGEPDDKADGKSDTEDRSIRDTLSSGSSKKKSPKRDVKSLKEEKEPAPKQMVPSLHAYVAPSPYEENRAKVGNEEATRPVPELKNGLVAPSDTVGGTVAWQELSQAISDLEGDGYQVAISVGDLATGENVLAYNHDAGLYPASAIKGPYVMSIWEETESPSGSLTRWTEAVLGWSDNDAYHSLRETYGEWPMRRLVDECDLELPYYGGEAYTWCKWYYPRTSAHDMNRMWFHFSSYLLDMGSDNAATLREMMTEREVSPIRDALPTSATTYAKAGWLGEYGDYGATPAAVDAGIVLWPDGRSYVVTIMTDTEEDMEAVSRLAACVDRVIYAMENPVSK